MALKRFLLIVSLLVSTAVFLAACGGATSQPEAVEVTRVVTDSERPSAVGSESTVGDSAATPDSGPKVTATRAPVGTAVGVSAVEAEVAAEAAPALAADTFSADARGGEAVTDAAALPLEQNSRLTAGEVDDNAQWDDYLLYLREYNGAQVMKVDVSERHQIWVTDGQERPLAGQEVRILAGNDQIAVLRTHSDGRVYFFPRAYSAQADAYQVQVDGAESFTIAAGDSQREWFVTAVGSGQGETAVNLDVMFLIDATGSMADEIQQLKDNIRAISAQVDALPSRPDVRFGLVAYRDQGDAFLTQVTDFTPDVETFAADLDRVQADGGGDYPEDLNQALSDAIHQAEWRVENTVSLIFLVADAPPHLDYGQQNHYAAEMLQAAQRGIKIYPIASSGLDEQGEYVFRQLAQATGGRFIFLTYGAEGPGSTGTETDFQVSDYTVSSLDDLVVNIIEEELAPLSQ